MSTTEECALCKGTGLSLNARAMVKGMPEWVRMSLQTRELVRRAANFFAGV